MANEQSIKEEITNQELAALQQEMDRLAANTKNQRPFWEITEGKHEVLIESSVYQAPVIEQEWDGKIVKKKYVDVSVKGVPLRWSISYADTVGSMSLYGQLVKTELVLKGLVGRSITLLVQGKKGTTNRKYTVLEAV